ncbi:MAG: signal peptide peptidase SppA [Haliscomenobacter sp.]|nr:signal peptide peptidase SppA [Haliscomenobacter sp.]
MGSFFKMLFASCLGVVLGIILLTLIGASIVGAIASAADKPQKIGANSVLRLTLDQIVPEHTNNVDIQPFNLEQTEVYGLTDMVGAIERAKDDDHIKGILLETDMAMISGFATTRVLREALLDFKKSGKFIFSHGKFYFPGNYYLASTADQIFINPLGISEIRGFSIQIPFYKNLIDRLGVKMQIYYAGKFKGATEPYRLERLSPENRYQYKEFLNDIYDIFLADVAASRKMKPEELRRVIDGYLADSPERAVETGLMDKVLYRDEVTEELRKKLGFKKTETVSLVSINDFILSNPEKKDYKIKDKIAIVYAEGTILDGKGSNGSIGDSKYVKTLEKIAKDDKVKAVVLRVNSPGGSALASENILHAINKIKGANKPIVVSMGDYAASGGYFIACQADSIFAEPNTITGSIGVFRMIPSLERTLSDKVGVRFDSVKTGPFAAGLNLYFDQDPQEAAKMQAGTEEMYEVFLGHVAKGRKMKRDSVHAIAQGRVWSGRDALRIGLVDRLGGLDEALEAAAKLAKVKSYRTAEYPTVPNPIQQLVEELMGAGSPETRMVKTLKRDFPELAPAVEEWLALKRSHGVQARLPVEVRLK